MAVEKINLNISSISKFRDKYKKALIIAAVFSAIMAILDGESVLSSFIFGFIWLSIIFCGIVAS